MNKPESIKYEVKSIDKTIIVDHPNQLVVEQGYPCLNGGRIKHNGQIVKCLVRYDNKPELAARVESWKKEWEVYESKKAAEFSKNVPGLKELEDAQDAAYNEQARYDSEFERMMNTGHSISPKSVDERLNLRRS